MEKYFDDLWARRDPRVEDWPFMSSPLSTIALCAGYVYFVKVAGPQWMSASPP